ncbi:shikimate dehydrogenase family protein [Roseimaritima ulvae]|uniref:shikimate dehydrogenase family protein n=1 Tax=Roseimaritima ulvae TaxID=980254 RepID=UPI00138FC5D9|nr:hypothetical protein [Roseimaritima ulvae]
MFDSPIQPIACVMGHPIAGNPTQFAVERALAAADIDLRFLSLDVPPEQLPDAIGGVRAMGFWGVILAEPHRQAAAALCDQLSDEAQAAERVDVIERTDEGQLWGHYFGSLSIATAIERAIREPDARGKITISVLGNCPAMLAAVRPLMARGHYRWRVSEFQPYMSELSQELHEVDSVDQAIDETTAVVIRGTVDDEPCEVPETLLDRLSDPALVIDLAEMTSTSPLARYAAQRGLQSMTRLDLLVELTVRALGCWTEQTPEEAIIREAYEEYLEI